MMVPRRARGCSERSVVDEVEPEPGGGEEEVDAEGSGIAV